MKRRVIIGATAAFVLLAAFISVWLWERSSGRLENWIGQHFVAVAQSHISPRITIGALHYQSPRNVLVSSFALVAGNQTILSIDRIELQLAETPRRGKPMQIQRIDFERPQLMFVAQPDGGFLGWTGFLRPGRHRPARLSDALVLHHIEIHDGEVNYADARGNSEPITVPGIELALDTPPDAGNSGWLRLNGTIERATLLRAQLDGRFNPNTALLELARLELQLTLGEDQYSALPPRLQAILRAHQLRGGLTAQVKGQVPLRQPGDAQIEVHAELQNGAFAYGEAALADSLTNRATVSGSLQAHGHLPTGPIDISASGLALQAGGQTIASIHDLTAQLAGRLAWRDWRGADAQLALRARSAALVLGNVTCPVQALHVQSHIAGEQLTVEYDGTLVGGDVQGRAGLALASPATFSAEWSAGGLKLEDLLNAAPGDVPKYAGRIAAGGTAAGCIGSWPGSLSGDGTLDVTHGRLVELPVVRELLAAFARTRLGSQLTCVDQAHAVFSIQPDHIFVSSGQVSTLLAVLTGHGQIYYDRRLNLEVHLTPPSGFQRLTGRVGETLGKIGARAVTYRVGGTIGRPEIRVARLGR